ncbi:unnamed protein product, partial [Meganyctiphanes norvegica]
VYAMSNYTFVRKKLASGIRACLQHEQWSIFDQKQCMAGHSKWSNIRQTEGAEDQQEATLFAKMAGLMRLAIRENNGNNNPKTNTALARAVEMAKGNTMPVAAIERVLASANKTQDNARKIQLEYRGPSATFLLVDLLTDNIMRSKTLINTAIKKRRIQEIGKGKARHLFEEKGIIIVNSSTPVDSDAAMEHAIEVGAEDVIQDEEFYEFTCAPEDFLNVKQGLENLNYNVSYSSVDFVPISPVTISPEDEKELEIITQKLEDLADVSKVYANVE